MSKTYKRNPFGDDPLMKKGHRHKSDKDYHRKEKHRKNAEEVIEASYQIFIKGR